jgi:glycopeptide antibiotics resistance protein
MSATFNQIPNSKFKPNIKTKKDKSTNIIHSLHIYSGYLIFRTFTKVRRNAKILVTFGQKKDLHAFLHAILLKQFLDDTKHTSKLELQK